MRTPPARENHNELWYGWLSGGLEERKPYFRKGKQHRKPDTTYMFVRDYSVFLIRLTMLQNIQTGGGFKAVIGGTYTGKTPLNHF